MDLRQIEYIVTIADSNSVTEAAEKLFISQSGLNQQLVKLEKELGVQLFERGKRYFHITHAGEIYVKNAIEILKIKRNTYSLLSDIRKDLSGELILGLTHEHGIDLFSAIYPEFHQKYPNVHLQLSERIVRDQIRMIKDGRLDYGIVLLKEIDEDSLIYEEIYKEELILGVPLSHPLAKYAGSTHDTFPIVDLEMFRDETFSLMFPSSSMRRQVIDPLFKKVGFRPNLLIETSMNHALVQIVSKGFSNTIIPHSRVLTTPLAKNCAWFRLTDRPHWGIYLARRHDTAMSNAYKCFVELAKKYGKLIEEQFKINF